MSNKIIFLDTVLHNHDATGITLSNLFMHWSKDDLFMIGNIDKVNLSNREGYHNTYTLSNKEICHAFPLNFIKFFYSYYKSVLTLVNPILNYTNNTIIQSTVPTNNISSRSTFKKLFIKLGLDHLFYRYKITPKLDEWIKQTNPDYFYATLSTRHSILFAKEIINKYKRPLIIHIMDDWPTTICKETIFNKFWFNVINKEFCALLTESYARIAISKSMAEEYAKRYNNQWVYFHNPVFLDKWLPYQKKVLNSSNTPLKIGYFGRIGIANQYSIEKFIKVISSRRLEGQLELHLYSYDNNKYDNIPNVHTHQFIHSNILPSIISNFNFLLLPLSFLSDDIQFSRFSIPTKLSEYLISGVPVILLGPKEIAVSQFVRENKCGLCIFTDIENEIESTLSQFIFDTKKQEEYSENAKSIALKNFEVRHVNKDFQKIFHSNKNK